MSLLELGAGFDPELTGAQNVFFNGVILGLTEDEVAARYDAILEFAELDRQAMDLPVRMYSSGMQLRLGFAIAVHLQAEVLLVDEGLAVGDEGFQEKCFRKMEEFKTQGKTILMVTHELDHVERLADRVLWLENGVIRARRPDRRTFLAEYRARLPSAWLVHGMDETEGPRFPSRSFLTTRGTCCGPACARWRSGRRTGEATFGDHRRRQRLGGRQHGHGSCRVSARSRHRNRRESRASDAPTIWRWQMREAARTACSIPTPKSCPAHLPML